MKKFRPRGTAASNRIIDRLRGKFSLFLVDCLLAPGIPTNKDSSNPRSTVRTTPMNTKRRDMMPSKASAALFGIRGYPSPNVVA